MGGRQEDIPSSLCKRLSTPQASSPRPWGHTTALTPLSRRKMVKVSAETNHIRDFDLRSTRRDEMQSENREIK